MRDCPCKHRNELFYPGESITVDCNTCTCLEGMFKCTTEDCNMICNVYSQSQYVLFDQFWEKYPSGDCDIELLAGSDQGANRFSVSVKQDRCVEHGGAVCRKRVQIQFGSTVITMKGSDIETVRALPQSDGRMLRLL
ncbi:von Willebrand factor-like [Huso huso]|uniref:von Willebrand factor-like n=1 Tax=Huso huso TaxID=61971 RepID=A0ABR0Y2Z3_HUSHU